MSTVLQFRGKPFKGTQAANRIPPDAPRFFCVSCNASRFFLMEDGRVICATEDCFRLIKNITVNHAPKA